MDSIFNWQWICSGGIPLQYNSDSAIFNFTQSGIFNMSLITETNQQYYEGAQGFIGTGRTKSFTATFNTDLVWFTALSTDVNYALNNFKLYK